MVKRLKKLPNGAFLDRKTGKFISATKAKRIKGGMKSAKKRKRSSSRRSTKRSSKNTKRRTMGGTFPIVGALAAAGAIETAMPGTISSAVRGDLGGAAQAVGDSLTVGGQEMAKRAAGAAVLLGGYGLLRRSFQTTVKAGPVGVRL